MSDFYSMLTNTGMEKMAQLLNGESITLSYMAFGNSTIAPTEDQTELNSEQYRCELTKVAIDPNAPNSVIAEAVIKSDVGGFWIREIGVFDSDGDLFAVGKYPATYKPLTTEGSVKELGVRMILKISNADTIVVTYNNGIMDGAANTDLDNLTFAGQQKFNNKADKDLGNLTPEAQQKFDDKANTDLDNLTEDGQKKFDDKADKDLGNLTPAAQQKFDNKANTDLGNLTQAGQKKFDDKANIESPQFTGTPTAPTASVGTNNTQLANTAFVVAAINALVNSAPAALDTLNELAAALGNDPNFATTITNALAGKAAKTGDTISVASANPTTGFYVRNVKAQNTDPGEGSALTTGHILLTYE